MQMVQNVATKVRNVFTLVLARKSSFYATWHLTLTNKNPWLLSGNSKASRKILLLWIVISYAHYRNPPVWRTNSNIMWGIAKLLARLFAQPVQFYKQMSKGLKNHAFSKLCLKVYYSSISKCEIGFGLHFHCRCTLPWRLFCHSSQRKVDYSRVSLKSRGNSEWR